jgi:hypothetical protein
MSLITGNKVKIHTSQGEKEKDKADKRILRSLSFDNKGLVKPSCGTVALWQSPHPRKLLKSSILWTKKRTSETAKHYVFLKEKSH